MDFFLPPVQAWFRRRFGTPTEVQRLAWPCIERGESILALAPTGSGKTLAAFLALLNAFAAGRFAPGRTRVLYVSPLRALNNDMHRNLLAPLEELKGEFEANGNAFPPIRVQTRSGDTEQRERRHMLLHPPEILITTPESLNVLLSSGAADRMLGGLQAVILDEIHALVSSKRGVHLMTAVERLVEIAGDFQRVGLSASVANPGTVASYLGGYASSESAVTRTVRIVHANDTARFALDIVPVVPAVPVTSGQGDTDARTVFFHELAGKIDAMVTSGRRVLCFTESRRMAEKVAALLNDRHAESVAFAHHGSLSRELRLSIEERFKAGRLPCVVATSSLELGIDIGDLDEVVLLQCPGSSSRALQRLGRAGHRPGEVSHGTAFPLHDLDLLRMVVLRRMVERHELEPLLPVENPLDLLAQLILSMACEAESAGRLLDAERAFRVLQRSFAYRRLDPRHFRLVVAMLEGRFQGLSQTQLRPRLRQEAGAYAVAPGARLQLYQSGGTIGERGQFVVRIAGSGESSEGAGGKGGRGAPLGEFDEEFVFERKVGDRVVLGSRLWQITSIGENDVEVAAAGEGWGMNPFWRADGRDMDNRLADRLAETLERWSLQMEAAARDGASADAFARSLVTEEGEATAASLLDLFDRIRGATGAGLPHRHRIIAECPVSESGAGGYPIYYHTFWGGRRNRPFAIAVVALLERETGVRISHYVTDEGLLLILPEPFGPDEPRRILSLVTPENLLPTIEAALPGSTLFGSAFRQAAGTALLLPSRGFGRRTPFWLHRLVAGRLLEALSGKGEFPVTLEAWRMLVRDRFDLEGLRERIEEIEAGSIEIVRCDVVTPGPLTSGLEYQRTGDVMYRSDVGGDSGHGTSFFSDLVGIPPLPPEVVREFEDRSLRRGEGYRPETEEELREWLEERAFLPGSEWAGFKQREGAVVPPEGVEVVDIVGVVLAEEPLVCSFDGAALLLRLFPDTRLAGEGREGELRQRLLLRAEALNERAGALPSLADLLERFLLWYGPVEVERLQRLFGDRGQEGFEELVHLGAVLRGQLLRGDASEHLCHRTNLERLHRLSRRTTRSAPPVRPASDLPLFLARWQGLTDRQEGPPEGAPERLRLHFEKLFGFVAPAAIWESDLLPARMCQYRTAWLDALMRESDLAWTGCTAREAMESPSGGRSPRPSSGSPVFFFLATEAMLFRHVGPAATGGEKTDAVVCDPMLEEYFPDGAVRLLPGPMTEKNQAWLLERLRAGKLASLSGSALRGAVRSRFRVSVRDAPVRRSGRWGRGNETNLLFRPWLRRSQGSGGDPMEEEERRRDRCRLLLDRYGLLFRDLLARELPEFQWKALVRTLCRMELAGEVLGGRFFDGLSGLQFLRPSALRLLSEALPQDSVYWMNAKDPASLCGIPGFSLPARQMGTRLVYRGSTLVAVFLRGGRALEFRLSVQESFAVAAIFGEIMDRDFDPPVRWVVESINGESACGSSYRAVLESVGFRPDGRRLVRYRSTPPAPMP